MNSTPTTVSGSENRSAVEFTTPHRRDVEFTDNVIRQIVSEPVGRSSVKTMRRYSNAVLLWRGIKRNEAAEAAWRRKLERRHAAATDAELNYPEAGITRAEHPPKGFRELLIRERIGNGESDFVQTSGALRDGRMHTGAGLDVYPDPAGLDTDVVFLTALTIGPIASIAPCRVVAVDNDVLQVTVAYGTLTGHPLRGEEAFTIALEDGGTVWLTIRAHSKPGSWWQRPTAPIIRRLQLLMANRYAAALKSAKEPATGG